MQLAEDSSAAQALPSVEDVIPECIAQPPAAAAASPAAEVPSSTDILTDTYLLPELDAEVMSFFAPEAHEYIETI